MVLGMVKLITWKAEVEHQSVWELAGRGGHKEAGGVPPEAQGKGSLLTVLTPSMSSPRAATSVATRMSICSSLKRLETATNMFLWTLDPNALQESEPTTRTQTLLESSSRVQTIMVGTGRKCQPNNTYMPPKYPTTYNKHSFVCTTLNRNSYEYGSSVTTELDYKKQHMQISQHSRQPLRNNSGASLVVQWLRLWAPSAGGPGSIPGQGTRSHMLQLNITKTQYSQISKLIKKKKRKTTLNCLWWWIGTGGVF